MVPLMKEYVEALRARDSTPAALLPVNTENEKLVDQYRNQAQQKLKGSSIFVIVKQFI